MALCDLFYTPRNYQLPGDLGAAGTVLGMGVGPLPFVDWVTPGGGPPEPPAPPTIVEPANPNAYLLSATTADASSLGISITGDPNVEVTNIVGYQVPAAFSDGSTLYTMSWNVAGFLWEMPSGGAPQTKVIGTLWQTASAGETSSQANVVQAAQGAFSGFILYADDTMVKIGGTVRITNYASSVADEQDGLVYRLFPPVPVPLVGSVNVVRIVIDAHTMVSTYYAAPSAARSLPAAAAEATDAMATSPPAAPGPENVEPPEWDTLEDA